MIDETVVGGAKPVKLSKPARAAKEKTVVAKKKVAAKAAKGKAKPAKKVDGVKAQTSGEYIRELIAQDLETDEILAKNLKKFPNSKAKACDVSWNRGYAARMKAAKKTSKK